MPNDTPIPGGYGSRQQQVPQPRVQAAPQAQQPMYGQPAYGPYYRHVAEQQRAYPQQAAYVPPTTSRPVAAPHKKRRKGAIIAAAVALGALIIAGIIAFNMLFGGRPQRAGSLGQLEGKTADEIQAELNRIVDDGMFNISIASFVEFPDGQSEGEVKIENVPGNKYLMRVDIARDDTGEVIYTSGVLEPNFHIQRDTLDVDLDPGSYECTATFYALDPETEQEVGHAGAKMQVSVLA